MKNEILQPKTGTNKVSALWFVVAATLLLLAVLGAIRTFEFLKPPSAIETTSKPTEHAKTPPLNKDSATQRDAFAVGTPESTETPTDKAPTTSHSLQPIHRLASPMRSAFDAFIYVNRISIEPEEDESMEDLTGRILGRLANQEGRVLVKLPPGMTSQSYDGFKVALETGTELHSGRCFECHLLPNCENQNSTPPVPSLRNLAIKTDRLTSVLKNKNHRTIHLNESDIANLNSWLQTLADVEDSEFRELIIKSTVMGPTGENE